MWCLNWKYEPATCSGWSEFHREMVWRKKENWRALVCANGWYNWREFVLKLWGICLGVKKWHRPWLILNSRHNFKKFPPLNLFLSIMPLQSSRRCQWQASYNDVGFNNWQKPLQSVSIPHAIGMVMTWYQSKQGMLWYAQLCTCKRESW